MKNRLTKTDGLTLNEWVYQLMDMAKSFGYFIHTEKNPHIATFYNNDYSAEDAWQEIFEEMDNDSEE